MPNFHPSDTMTSLTPLSFIDDGVNIKRRLQSGSQWNISKWVDETAKQIANSRSSTSSGSTYIGSYIDDGADMLSLSNTAPGFGTIDPKFYAKGRKSKSKEPKWSEEMGKAVGGDMMRSLAKMRSTANIKVVDREEKKGATSRKSAKKEREPKVGEVDEKGMVRIRAPQTWGTFVIQGKDGRVTVIDENGEYDSGRPDQSVPQWSRPRKHKTHESRTKDREKKSQDVATGPRPLPTKALTVRSSKHSKADSGLRRRSSHSTTPLMTLAPVMGTSAVGADEGVLSPTKFFMTGGASSWSPPPSLVKPPTVTSSHQPSPPGAWPSRAPSPVKHSSPVVSPLPSPAKSVAPSIAGSVDSWKATTPWQVDNIHSVTEPSVIASSEALKTASIHRSRGGSKNSWQGEHSHKWNGDIISTSSSRKATSHTSSTAGSSVSWKQDVDDFHAHLSNKSCSSSSHPDAPGPAIWNQELPDNRSVHASNRPAAPEASAVTPYSWRRAVEEDSDHSTIGSSASQASSTANSRDSWQEGTEKPWKEDTDTRSIKSHSTYRPPTVEDASETPHEEVQEWNTGFNGKSSEKGSDRGSNGQWNAASGANGGSGSVCAGSAGKTNPDMSGFEEDNQTWLNSDWGGVKVREAEWRKAPAVGSWRDV